MQRVNITTKNNEDFCLTFQILDSKHIPYYISGAMFYMEIKEKESGSITVATISNDSTIERQGFVYIINETQAKIKLFLNKVYISDKKFVNTWRYDILMKQYNQYFNIMSGDFTILDSVTEISND